MLEQYERIKSSYEAKLNEMASSLEKQRKQVITRLSIIQIDCEEWIFISSDKNENDGERSRMQRRAQGAGSVLES